MDFSTFIQNITASHKNKKDLLKSYLLTLNEKELSWGVYLLYGNKISCVSLFNLKKWCCEFTNIPLWLFDECNKKVLDISETVSLILPKPKVQKNMSFIEMIEDILKLKDLTLDERKNHMINTWESLDNSYIFNRLISSNIKTNISHELLEEVLSEILDTDKKYIAKTLKNFNPRKQSFRDDIRNISLDFTDSSISNDNKSTYTINAVLIYATQGEGSFYNEYTFGVWDRDSLIPIARVNELSEKDINQVNLFIRKNTIKKQGPSRSVIPKLIFELTFNHIEKSKRNKSGLKITVLKTKLKEDDNLRIHHIEQVRSYLNYQENIHI